MQARVEVRWRVGRHVGQRERELRRDDLPGLPLAADHLEVVRGEQAGKGEESRLRPLVVEEVVVARRAFHAGAEKHLRHVGRALDRIGLRVVQDVAADRMLLVRDDVNARFVARERRIDQRGGKHVVGNVGGQLRVDPAAIVATRRDAALQLRRLASQGFFPERRPVRGVVAVPGEQRVDEHVTLVRRAIADEAPRLLSGRHDTCHVQRDATDEARVVDGRRRLVRLGQARLHPRGGNELVDGIVAARVAARGRGSSARQAFQPRVASRNEPRLCIAAGGLGRRVRRHEGRDACSRERAGGVAFRGRQPIVERARGDPRADERDLIVGERPVALGHARMPRPKQVFHQRAGVGTAGDDRRACLLAARDEARARRQVKIALGLIVIVTLEAPQLEDGTNLV